MRSSLRHALMLMKVITPTLSGTSCDLRLDDDPLGLGRDRHHSHVVGPHRKARPLMCTQFGTLLALLHIYVPFIVLTCV
jgi:hypothetical protein